MVLKTNNRRKSDWPILLFYGNSGFFLAVYVTSIMWNVKEGILYRRHLTAGFWYQKLNCSFFHSLTRNRKNHFEKKYPTFSVLRKISSVVPNATLNCDLQTIDSFHYMCMIDVAQKKKRCRHFDTTFITDIFANTPSMQIVWLCRKKLPVR